MTTEKKKSLNTTADKISETLPIKQKKKKNL